MFPGGFFSFRFLAVFSTFSTCQPPPNREQQWFCCLFYAIKVGTWWNQRVADQLIMMSCVYMCVCLYINDIDSELFSMHRKASWSTLQMTLRVARRPLTTNWIKLAWHLITFHNLSNLCVWAPGALPSIHCGQTSLAVPLDGFLLSGAAW